MSPLSKMLECKELERPLPASAGSEFATIGRPMTHLEGLLAKLNGWVLSLILHSLVGALAAWSVFDSSTSGGSGWGSGGGAAGGGGSPDTYETSLHSEELVSGEPVADLAQYGSLTEDVPEPTNAEVLPQPVIPFDVFAVGAAELPPPPPTPPSLSDPLTARPATAEDRGAKLPGENEQQGPGS